MENYYKGQNIEEPLERSKIPIENLPENFLWVQVKAGSKISQLLSFALKDINETKSVVWTGVGPSVAKAISCAEIMKKRRKGLHQETKICFRKVEEFWEPKIPELDRLVVTRKLPMVHVLLRMNDICQTTKC